MKQNDVLDVSGHLQIIKVYKDGTEEKVYDDHNVITSGMGVGLSMLFAGQGSSIADFQIRYFQVGSGAPTSYDYTQNKLEKPIDNVSYYGEALLSTHKRMLSNGEGSSNEIFAYIPGNAIKKSSPTSVTYILYLTEEAIIPWPIDEVGLFMNNPLSTIITLGEKRSPLVAYRTFNAITKTGEYSLVFKWKLSF